MLNFDSADLRDCQISLPQNSRAADGRAANGQAVNSRAALLLDSSSAAWGGTNESGGGYRLEKGILETSIMHFSGQYFLLE